MNQETTKELQDILQKIEPQKLKDLVARHSTIIQSLKEDFEKLYQLNQNM